MSRNLLRVAAGAGGAAALVLSSALPASAHVAPQPGEVTEGSFPRISFLVPTEMADADTRKVEMYMPKEYKLEGSVKPTAGWDLDIKWGPDGVGRDLVKATWTAKNDDAEIKPGEYQTFELLVGPIPKVDKVYFKTVQTYDNGKKVNWTELPTPENPNPEHPAPWVDVVPAAKGEKAGKSAAQGHLGARAAADGKAGTVDAANAVGVPLDRTAKAGSGDEGFLDSSPVQMASAGVLLAAGGLVTRSAMRRRARRAQGE